MKRDVEWACFYLELREVDSRIAEWAFTLYKEGATVQDARERLACAMAIAETYPA